VKGVAGVCEDEVDQKETSAAATIDAFLAPPSSVAENEDADKENMTHVPADVGQTDKFPKFMV